MKIAITYDPATHVLVPREMTIEMSVAAFGRESIEHTPGLSRVDDEAARFYAYLIAAAPEVEPQPQQGALPVLKQGVKIVSGWPEQCDFNFECTKGGCCAGCPYAATPAPAVDAIPPRVTKGMVAKLAASLDEVEAIRDRSEALREKYGINAVDARCKSKSGEWSQCQLETLRLYEQINGNRPFGAVSVRDAALEEAAEIADGWNMGAPDGHLIAKAIRAMKTSKGGE